MRIYVYIRDDDVYRLDRGFLRTFTLFKKYRIPVIYGIIPGLADKELTKFLNNEKNNNPKLFDIVQHGWKHKNYNRNTKHKYEFGISRSYHQQKQDIQNGYLKMKEYFGKNFTPAFIPPYHGYNQITLKIINELKIPIFSADKFHSLFQKKFIELPTPFSLNKYDIKGRPIVLDVNLLIRLFLKNLKTCKGLLGILFHHSAIKNDNDFKGIKNFLFFLKELNRNKTIKFILFSDFLRNRHCIV